MDLNPRELAAVLAGLRYWQRDIAADHPLAFANGIDAIANNMGKVVPLTPPEIDTLCERLNTAAKPIVHAHPVNYVCRRCGSDQILFDAYATWDPDAQENLLQNVFEKPVVCESVTCGGNETRAIEVPYVDEDLDDTQKANIAKELESFNEFALRKYFEESRDAGRTERCAIIMTVFKQKGITP